MAEAPAAEAGAGAEVEHRTSLKCDDRTRSRSRRTYVAGSRRGLRAIQDAVTVSPEVDVDLVVC